MKYRVKAFTIMELTIALLLTAVVIAITYTCYSIIYKSYLAFNSHQQRLTEINQFNRVIERDIENGQLILKRTDGIVIKTKNVNINYIFRPTNIVRVTANADTFKLITSQVTTYFEGSELQGSGDGGEENRLDAISFTISSGNDNFPYYYFKHYSSENLINKNPNAVN